MLLFDKFKKKIQKKGCPEEHPLNQNFEMKNYFF